MAVPHVAKRTYVPLSEGLIATVLASGHLPGSYWAGKLMTQNSTL